MRLSLENRLGSDLSRALLVECRSEESLRSTKLSGTCMTGNLLASDTGTTVNRAILTAITNQLRVVAMCFLVNLREAVTEILRKGFSTANLNPETSRTKAAEIDELKCKDSPMTRPRQCTQPARKWQDCSQTRPCRERRRPDAWGFARHLKFEEEMRCFSRDTQGGTRQRSRLR